MADIRLKIRNELDARRICMPAAEFTLASLHSTVLDLFPTLAPNFTLSYYNENMQPTLLASPAALVAALQQQERYNNCLTLCVNHPDCSGLSDSLAREQDEFVILGDSLVSEQPVPSAGEPELEVPEDLRLPEEKREAPAPRPLPEGLTDQLEEFLGSALPQALNEGSAAVQDLFAQMAVSLEQAKPVADEWASKASDTFQKGAAQLNGSQVEQVAATVKDTLGDVFQQTSTTVNSLFTQLFPAAAPAHKAPFDNRALRFECAFVRDVQVEDGEVMAPGAAFTKTWEIKNSGDCAWPHNCSLQFVGGDKLFSQAERARMEKGVAVGPLPAGQSARVSVRLTAPQQPGKYTAFFRLCCAVNGKVPFGDRLWCSLTVADPAAVAEEPVASVYPYQSALDRLSEMGFAEEASRVALAAFDGSFDSALLSLVGEE